MTASTRFIGLAVFTWAGVRAISLGLVPGSGALAIDRPASAATRPASELPPIEPTEFAPIEPAAAADPAASEPIIAQVQTAPAGPTATVQLVPARAPARVAYYPAYLPSPAYAPNGYAQSAADVRLASAEASLPPPRRPAFGSAPLTTQLPPARMASAAMPERTVTVPAVDATAAPLLRHSKRLELSSWALLRGKPGDLLGPNSLAASNATLGGSQAGARINYWITPHLAASLRSSTPIGGARGGEVAAGVRYQPFLNLPFSITAERRQRFGRAGGRNDFALFAEGGLWDRAMPFGFRLDAYAQAGIVGIGTHDLFGDGAFTLTRPLWKNISGGFGVWGGAQPHLYRLDAGPRLTIRMTKSMRIHADYRQRLAGSAFPSSGPAVTIAGDF
ncbi:MAG: hypothetical protein ABR588_08755 [Sphingomicrobium sp.]|nr:hypothetical protein [Sphingomonadales bacterium]